MRTDRLLKEKQAELDLIRSQIDELEELAEPEGDEALRAQINTERDAKLDTLIARHQEIDKEMVPLRKTQDDLDAIRSAARDQARTESGDGSVTRTRYLDGRAPGFNPKIDPFDTDPRRMTNNDVISRAMTVLDREKLVPVSDAGKGHLEWLIHRSYNDDEEGGQFDGSYVARRTLYTENPLYRSAFRKYVRFGAMAHLNEGEARAVSAFQDYELRRAAGEVTTTAGGFGVPVKLAA